MDREEARQHREMQQALAKGKAEEQETKRQTLVTEIHGASSCHKMMELLGAVDPEDVGIHSGRWETTMTLVERYPHIVFGLKDGLFVALHRDFFLDTLTMGFTKENLKGKIFWHMDARILGLSYPLEDSVPALPATKGRAILFDDEIRSYRMAYTAEVPNRMAVQKKVGGWIREISAAMGGERIVEDHIGLGPIPDDLVADSHLPLLGGLRLDFCQLEHMERKNKPTEAFCIRVVKGCEALHDALVERLVQHNKGAWAHPRNEIVGDGPQLIAVKGEAGCILWDPATDYAALRNAVTMSEHYMSYFIGPEGSNIRDLEKRIAKSRRGGEVRITPLCLPGSPQFPVIFATSRLLVKGEVDVLLEFIDETAEKMHPEIEYDPY